MARRRIRAQLIIAVALAVGASCAPTPAPAEWFAPGCYVNPSIGAVAFEYRGPADTVGNASRWFNLGNTGRCTAGPLADAYPVTLVRIPSTTAPETALTRCRQLMVSTEALNIGRAGFGMPDDAWLCLPDLTPPTVSVPTRDVVVSTDDPTGAVVTFAASATDAGMPVPPNVTCSPASGSVFPVGATRVTCEATDLAGLSSEARFMVRVVLGPLWPDPACYRGGLADIRPSGVPDRVGNAEQFGSIGGTCTGSPTAITLVRANDVAAANQRCISLLPGSLGAVNPNRFSGSALPADAWQCI